MDLPLISEMNLDLDPFTCNIRQQKLTTPEKYFYFVDN
jgi:hypothetical protein